MTDNTTTATAPDQMPPWVRKMIRDLAALAALIAFGIFAIYMVVNSQRQASYRADCVVNGDPISCSKWDGYSTWSGR